MVSHKTTTTQGVWKEDGIAFQRITKEFDIPTEIMNKGITAIIDWVNESKSTVAKIAIGGLILSALSTEIRNPPKPICEKAGLLKRENLITILTGSDLNYQGNIENESFELIKSDSQRITTVPTAVIESVYRIGKKHFLLKCLDGTKMQCDLVTSPILFHKKEGFLSHSGIIKVKPDQIKYIDGTKYSEPIKIEEVASDIKNLIKRD